MNFNTNILLKNYHIWEVWLPDKINVEYEKRVFNKLKYWITKRALMSMDYKYEITWMDISNDDSDKVKSYAVS